MEIIREMSEDRFERFIRSLDPRGYRVDLTGAALFTLVFIVSMGIAYLAAWSIP